MQEPFTLDVFKTRGKTSFISKGYLKCVVTTTTFPFHYRQFAHCLHCRKLRSLSWFCQHKRDVGFLPSLQMIDLFNAKFDSYVQDITTEVELLNDMGRLFNDGRQRVPASTPAQQQELHVLSVQDDEEPGSFGGNQPELASDQPLLFLDEDEEDIQDGLPLQTERMAQCVTDCFEEYCFVDNSFDLNKFALLSQKLLDVVNERNDHSSDSFNRIKSIILSFDEESVCHSLTNQITS